LKSLSYFYKRILNFTGKARNQFARLISCCTPHDIHATPSLPAVAVAAGVSRNTRGRRQVFSGWRGYVLRSSCLGSGLQFAPSARLSAGLYELTKHSALPRLTEGPLPSGSVNSVQASETNPPTIVKTLSRLMIVRWIVPDFATLSARGLLKTLSRDWQCSSVFGGPFASNSADLARILPISRSRARLDQRALFNEISFASSARGGSRAPCASLYSPPSFT